MTARLILGAFQTPSRHSRISASLANLLRRSAARNSAHSSPCSSAQSSPRRRGQESGYAFLFVLGLILVMIAVSVSVLQMGATIRRRRIEQETIWRGHQYARAIRLYYHKTGHYPQTLDDLVKGMPDLHFLRQAYKNPTNPGDGSWRFIYVNANGQIIGSTKYANLQQMALMDANGGQLPTLQGQPGQPGQPGVPVSTLAGASSGANSQPPQSTAPVTNDNSTGSTPAGYTPPDSTRNGAMQPGSTLDASGNPTQNGQNSGNPNGDNSQNPQSNTQNSQNPQSPQNPLNSGASSSSQNNLGISQNNIQGLTGLGQAGLAVDPATLAAMALLKPTGPVDGPVLGGFLTGVGCIQDTHSQRVYHGAKKYIDWEFIWNPLEDAAAAMQQQLGGAQGGGLAGSGQGQGTTSPFGAAPGSPATSNQQNPSPSPSPSNPFQQQPQQPQQTQPQ
jgi:hypothetical protein